MCLGCKHGKVDQNSALEYQNYNCGSKVLFKWDFFHDELYCCVKYSIVEYDVEIFKTNH